MTYRETLHDCPTYDVLPDSDADRLMISDLLRDMMPEVTSASCSVSGDVDDDGMMALHGTARVDWDMWSCLDVPQVEGRVGLALRLDSIILRWRYDGDGMYYGGDGPAANAGVLLQTGAR